MTDNIKKRIVELLLTFCMVTTGSVFVCAVYNNIFWPNDVYPNADVILFIPIGKSAAGGNCSIRACIICISMRWCLAAVMVFNGWTEEMS